MPLPSSRLDVALSVAACDDYFEASCGFEVHRPSYITGNERRSRRELGQAARGIHSFTQWALDKSHCSGLEYPSNQHFLPLDLMSNGFKPRSKSTTVCWCLDDLTAPVGDFCASVSYRKRSERVSEMRWVQWWSTAMDERTHKESHFGSLDT